MDSLDLFFKKYAYKFPKGYPDLNDEQDINLLADLLENLGVKLYEQEEEKPDYDGQILNLLTSLSDDTAKKKVIAYLNKMNKAEDKDSDKLEKDIINILEKDKKLASNYAEYILLLSNKLDETDSLDSYLQSPTVTYEDLKSNNSFTSLFKDIPLSNIFKTKLIQTSGRGIGKGEIALIVFIKDGMALGGKKGETKGDIKIGSIEIEIKGELGALVPFDILKYGSKPTAELRKEFGDEIEIKQGERWPATLANLYNDSDNRKETLNKINNILKDFYSGRVSPLNDTDLLNKSLERYITDNLAKEYIKDKHILFIDKAGENYIIVESYDDYEQLITSGDLVISAFSDKFPRLTYVA